MLFSSSFGIAFQRSLVKGKIGSVFGTPIVGPRYSALGKIASKGAGFARRADSSTLLELGEPLDDEGADGSLAKE